MPKVKWSALDDAEPDDLEGGFYDTEKQGVPPAGTYDGVIKRLQIKSNKNSDDMLNAVIEIAEPKGSDKARYNGYGIWLNLNVTAQGAPYLKQFLQGLGISWSDFLNKTVTDSDDRPSKVVKIGNVTFEDKAVPCRFTAKRGKDYKDPTQDVLENPRLLKPSTEEVRDWDDSAEKAQSQTKAASSTDDDDEPPF